MTRTLACTLAFVVLGGALALAQRKSEYYIVDARGNTIYGERLTANADGDLTIQLDANAASTQLFKRGSYKTASIPKPRDLAALEQALAQKNYTAVLKETPAYFNRYQFLGWGGYVAYLEAMAHIETGSAAAGLQSADNGLKLGDRSQVELCRAKALALLGLKRSAEALPLLDKMITDADKSTAALAFNTRGRILAVTEGRQKDAVLEYLKTLLLFKPGAGVDAERTEARKAVTALLKEMRDPRAPEIEKIP